MVGTAVDAGGPAVDLSPLLADPKRSGLVLDFDGTLAPIVTDPQRARPLDGVVPILASLADKLGVVAVVSGRPVDFLQPLLPETLVVSGLYGLETIIGGERRDHDGAGCWREVVADVAARSDAKGPSGIQVERKGLSITLHYRARPDLAADTRSFVEAEAERSGLVVRAARMSWELHPPINVDKGTAVRDLANDFAALAYAGDDVGDFPGFDALDDLAGRGVEVLRIAVNSDEAPPGLLERADVVVDGPGGMRNVLARLDAEL